MKPTKEQYNRVSREYSAFLKTAESLQSEYGEINLTGYLIQHRNRISSQIAIQLYLIEENGFENSRMLSLGGWPGIALVVLNRLTGISGTLVDHPALLTNVMNDFYQEQGITTVAFDFCQGEKETLPVEGAFQIIECCQCIEHWNFSPIPVMKQLFGSFLDPDGRMLITVPNAASLFRRLAAVSGRNPYPPMQSFIDVDNALPGADVSPHWREYTAPDLRQLIEHCGGSCLQLSTASYAPAQYNSAAQRLYSVFNNAHPSLKENVEAVCCKK